MTRQTSGSIIAGIAAVGFLATAGLHATGYKMISSLAKQAPEALQAFAPALWLAISLDLVILGLIVGVVAFRPNGVGRVILIIAAMCPIGVAGLQLIFLGFIPPTALLLGIGALTLTAAAVLPRTSGLAIA